MAFSARLITPRAAIMTVFFAFGTAMGALAGSMPTVTARASVSATDLGLAITGWSLLTVIAMSSGGIIARHASHRRVLLLALPATALLTALILVAPSWWVFMAAYVVLGIVSGATDLFMNAEGASIEYDLKRPIFTAFHGSVSVALAVSAIAASFLSTMIGTWATALMVLMVFGAAWAMVRRVITARPIALGQAARISAIPNKLPLVFLGVAAGLIIAGETAAMLWSAEFLSQLDPRLAAIAGLGAAFFGLCNAVLRFPADGLRARFGDIPLMVVSLIVAILGFAVLAIKPGFAVSVVAFAAVGLGTAVLIPCVFALASAFVPANRAAGISFVSMVAGAPRVLAPTVFGLVAEQFGIGSAFGMIAAGLAVALALIALRQRL